MFGHRRFAFDFATAISLDPLNTGYRVRSALAEARTDSDSYDKNLSSLDPWVDVFSTIQEPQETIQVITLNASMLRELGLFDQTISAFKNLISRDPDIGRDWPSSDFKLPRKVPLWGEVS